MIGPGARLVEEVRTRPRRLLTVGIVVVLYAGLLAVAVDASFDGGRPVAAGSASIGGASSLTESGAGVPTASAVDQPGATGTTTAPAQTPQERQSTGRRSAGSPPGGTGPGATTSGTGGSKGLVAMGPGVSASELRIGFEVATNLQAAFGATGASGSPPEERRIVEAVVAWVNEHGGIAGRRVVPVIQEVDRTQGTFAAQAQATCARFTEDDQVFVAATTPVSSNDALLACMASKGTPLLENTLWPFDDAYYSQFAGILYQPGRASATDVVGPFVDGLEQLGWFAGSRVGLLRFDAPVHNRLTNDVLKPALARHGRALTEEVVVAAPQSISDFGALNAQLTNAVLRFRSSGVDHVMMLDVGGIMPFFFMKEAESQGYRPVYGLNSYNLPATQAQQQPAAQLRRAVGVGWIPAVDTYDREQPPNAARAQCTEIMRQAGIPLTYPTYTYYTHVYCDTVFFVKAALERAPDLTRAGFRAGVEALGGSWVGASTLATRFGPGRHGGAAAFQPIGFDDACACFRYSGTPAPLP